MATTFSQDNIDCAVLIAGGGLAGLTLARCLADAFIGSSRKIILVDRANLSKSDATVDSMLDVRSTALSHTTVDIYRQLKLWSQLQVGAAPIAAIHVSDKGHIAKAELSAEESGRDALGCVVENKELASVLLGAVKSHPNITLLDRSTVSEPKALQGGYQLTVMGESQAENRHITTALLIVADGTQSPLRTALGIDQQTDDYQQYALVTNIETQKPHAGVAYERFLPDGALACLPLMPVAGKHRNAIVWSMPRERCAALQSFDSDELVEAIPKVLGGSLGKVMAAGQVAG
ncbi:hypothetical protein GYB62_02625, partial [bacterium]|nr:hypothetical protein [bacterium]